MPKSSISAKEDHPGLAAIAAALKAARKAKGLSQHALSERTGMPQSHVSKVESAATDIRITSLLTLAHALDLDLALVPRRLMPAIEGLRRSLGAPDDAAAPAYRLDDEVDDHE